MRPSIEEELGIRRREPLDRHSSFKIGGYALYFAQPRDRESLAGLMGFARLQGLPWILIGNASNILFADEDFEGLVISLTELDPDRLLVEGPTVRVSTGMGLMRLAHLLAHHSLGGMEFVSTIPGTVGGALVMNAGFSRHPDRLNQMADWLVEIKVLGVDGAVKSLPKENIAFDYRSSNLKGQVIVEALFKLKPTPREEVIQELKANQSYRESVQELRYPSVGSVFKNPKDFRFSAGKMIDQAGLRGLVVGDAQIAEKHGNFIINRGQARARDVLELVQRIQSKVREKFGVLLELEMQYISSQSMLLSA